MTQRLFRSSFLHAPIQPERNEGPSPSAVPAVAIPPDRLVTLHHLDSDDLLEAARLGGLPSPSLGITKVDTPFLGFGRITLIGTRTMVDPRHTPVYACDAYTPSAPRVGRHKCRAPNLAEALARMVSPAARRRRGPYNLGRLLAETGTHFATLEAIEAARGRLVDPDSARDEREYLGGLLDTYVRAVAHYGPGRDVSTPARESAAMKALALAFRRGATADALRAVLFRRDFGHVPDVVLETGIQLMRALSASVTDYFEAKPARVVHVREFAGAVAPDNAPPEAFDLLRRAGLRIKRYTGRSQAKAIRALAFELARNRTDILYRVAVFPHVARGRTRRATALVIGTGRLADLADWATRIILTCSRLPPPWLVALISAILIRHAHGLCLFRFIEDALSR